MSRETRFSTPACRIALQMVGMLAFPAETIAHDW